MRTLIDANILLDVALGRTDLQEASGQAMAVCGAREHEAYVAWHTLSNVYYILRSQAGHDLALEFLEDLLQWVRVASVGHSDALRAFEYDMRDFEDRLQLAAAEACSADVILTRNVGDFRDPQFRHTRRMSLSHCPNDVRTVCW